jgi:hypothetical protein
VDPHVVEAMVFDGDQQLGDAVDIGLAADEADGRWAAACQARCSPPPKPISSQTSSMFARKSCRGSMSFPVPGSARNWGRRLSISPA